MALSMSMLNSLGQAAPLLADIAVKGILLSLAVTITAVCLRKRSAAIRHTVWLTGMSALLLLPAMASVLPAWQILPESFGLAGETTTIDGMSDRDEESAAPLRNETVGDGSIVAMRNAESVRVPTSLQTGPDSNTADLGRAGRNRVSSAADRVTVPVGNTAPREPAIEVSIPRESKAQSAVPPEPETAAAAPATRIPWPVLVAGIWLPGMLAMVARLLFSQLALWRLCRSAEFVESQDWRMRIKELCEELGVTSPVAVWKLSERVIPMACGVLRPRVVLPADFEEWDEARLRTGPPARAGARSTAGLSDAVAR